MLFNGYAMFEFESTFGPNYSDKIFNLSVENYEFVADAYCILAKQGELARRAMGLDPHPFLERKGLEYAINQIHQTDVANAITIGLTDDSDDTEDEEINLVLLEQQKKS